MSTGETCPRTCFSLAGVLVLAGGATPPTPAVASSTNISAALKRVQEYLAVHPWVSVSGMDTGRDAPVIAVVWVCAVAVRAVRSVASCVMVCPRLRSVRTSLPN